VTVLQRKASMQQIGLPVMPAIKLDNENIGGHYTPLQSAAPNFYRASVRLSVTFRYQMKTA